MIAVEEACLAEVLAGLESQLASEGVRFRHEARRAQDLSAQIVAAKRDVDKQMLASDEAVAHGLTKMKKEEVESLGKLIERPYFARIVLEEEIDGRPREIEFRLGHSSNIELRIIDWRKAPIAKLYYEYQEGDEYCEEIQGRERSGRIVLRNKVGIEEGKLTSISCRLGNFQKTDAGWVAADIRKRSGSAESYSQLPSVLSLITPEQFRTITGDADRAVLIRGVAGSGKTTVALHRLTWLLAGNRPDLTASDCAVVVLSPALQTYIKRSLLGLGADVAVLTYNEWTAATVAKAFQLASVDELESKRVRLAPPPGVRRVLESLAVLRTVESVAKDAPEETPYPEQILMALRRFQQILDYDETKLLDRGLITNALQYIDEVHQRGQFDPLEEALVTRLYQLRSGSMQRRSGPPAKYKHILADEIQDFTPAELATIVGSVEKPHGLTLVGDTSQASRGQSAFPVWEKLRKFWSLGESLSSFMTLAVSHRSTGAIMRLAHHVQGSPYGAHDGKPGRPPLWYHCETEDQGVQECIGWLERVTAKFPTSVCVVICKDDGDAREAESLLRPSFGPVLSRAENGKLDFQEGIIVTPVRFVKGLEFPNVFLWNPSAKNYPAEDQSRSLLYIAITRAEEHLAMATWGKASPLLPSPESHLVRGMRRTVEEEQERDEARD